MDIGIWRHESGFILRLFGSERQLTREEWAYLRMLMDAIDCGKDEAIGEGYVEIVREYELSHGTRDDLVRAGLLKPKLPIKRRF
jgi:hypothetical protein